MKKILVISFFLLGCEKFDVAADNPLDLNNPDYQKPEVLFTNAPTDGETISNNQVQIQIGGNELIYNYRYKVITEDEFVNSDWSQWSDNNKIELKDLNEFLYQVLIQGNYQNEDTSAVKSVSFTVDAVDGPALMFNPIRKVVEQGKNTTIHLRTDEISNLAALELTVNYDAGMLNVISVNEGSLFSNAGQSVFAKKINQTNGSIQIAVGVYGNNNPTINNNGVFAKIVVQPTMSSGSTKLSIIYSSLRNNENTSITINKVLDSELVIE